MSKINFGTAGVIDWIDGSGTVVFLPNYTTFEMNQAQDTNDTSSGNVTWETHNGKLKNWEGSLEFFFDDGSTAGTADFARIAIGTTGLWAVGPAGTATGKPKFGGSVTITKLDMAAPFAEPMTVKVSYKGNGAPYWVMGSAW